MTLVVVGSPCVGSAIASWVYLEVDDAIDKSSGFSSGKALAEVLVDNLATRVGENSKELRLL
jgi:hypothetical protein